ncbi:uncharacterized protein LOC142985458 [Anticarsia gemmatalis]|uniref:uncharacterized protein LOC142985458 n=1 Tax=Anticarsia gemmatalis TaxID=129554 RepID=UPI003F76CD7E
MAAAPGNSSTEEPSSTKPSITLWLSDAESGDDSDSEDNPIFSVFKAIMRKRAMESEEHKQELHLPKWKSSESNIDVRESMAIFTDEEDDDNEVKDPPTWSHNFKTFTGSPLPFTGTPGPTINSTDPYTIFTSIWDQNIMSLIVEETNKYAKQIEKIQEEEKVNELIRKKLDDENKMSKNTLNYKAMFGNNKKSKVSKENKNVPNTKKGQTNVVGKGKNQEQKIPGNTLKEKSTSNVLNEMKTTNNIKEKPSDTKVPVKAKPSNNLASKVADKLPDKVSVTLPHSSTPEMLKKVEWTDTTIDELYVIISLFTFVSIHSSMMEENLLKGTMLVLPTFPEIMTLERFNALCRCLHFNDNTVSTTDKKLAKVEPMLSHCNEKFAALYKPRQFLDVDDSLLLSKDGTAGGIRALARNIGIRTYELTEVFTGYVLKILQYPRHENRLTVTDKTNIVLDLVENYTNNGHRIVTDKYFSSVHLCRTLRNKGFDCIGDIYQTSKELPQAIQELCKDEDDPKLYRSNGNKIRVASQHCGDVSVIAWSEFNITAVSTYHSCTMRPNKKGIRRPDLIIECHKAKQKTMEKDEDLAQYALGKSKNERWYMVFFKRLLNITLRNSYIIYKSNKLRSQCLSQVGFRHKLGEQLLEKHGDKDSVKKAWLASLHVCDHSSDELDDLSDDESDCWTDLESDDSAECSIM